VIARTSLTEISPPLLERTFPHTFHFLEERERERIVQEFSQKKPPGKLRHFPFFLTQKKWPTELGFIPELASFELALELAAAVPDVARQGFDGVNNASEPQWYSARFRFDPAHQVFEADWPLEEILAEGVSARKPRSSTILIYRSQGKVSYRGLNRNEAQLIRALNLGVPLGQILERNRGPEFDAMTFHHWIESGLLHAIDW